MAAGHSVMSGVLCPYRIGPREGRFFLRGSQESPRQDFF